MNRPSLGHVQYLLGQLNRVSRGLPLYVCSPFLKIINSLVAINFRNLSFVLSNHSSFLIKRNEWQLLDVINFLENSKFYPNDILTIKMIQESIIALSFNEKNLREILKIIIFSLKLLSPFLFSFRSQSIHKPDMLC